MLSLIMKVLLKDPSTLRRPPQLHRCDIDKISRPSLLITDAFNATYTQPKRRLRDEQLMTNILNTLRYTRLKTFLLFHG